MFPISGGQIVVATFSGTLDHTGGLTFCHNGKKVTLTNFVMDTNTRQLTATVSGQSLAIFHMNLKLLTHATEPHRTVVATNMGLTVTSAAASALNSALGVSTFKDGQAFGVATLLVAVK